MKIIADTNILVRAVVGDDAQQCKAAQAALADAELVAFPVAELCELTWVLSQGYRIAARDIAETIRRLVNEANSSARRRLCRSTRRP